MSEQPIDQYLTLDKFKLMIQSKTTQFDDQYNQFVDDSNAKVQTALFRYIDTPLKPGSIYHSRASNAALASARSFHAMDRQLIEKSKAYDEQFNIELFGADGSNDSPKVGGLIQQLIAVRTSRTKTVMITVDPRNNKVPLPTQNDIFVFDEFA